MNQKYKALFKILLIFFIISNLLYAYDIEPITNSKEEALDKTSKTIKNKSVEDESNDFDDNFDEEFDDFDEEIISIKDPFKKINKIIFIFNDKLILWIINPVSKGYAKIIPLPLRKGFHNFFRNLFTPIRFINCFLQGKVKSSFKELSRFFINSSIGIFGFFDPALNYFKLEYTEEDFGQTLGRYGLGNGFYIVLPILGPSSLRDSIGLIVDYFLTPVSYLNDLENYSAQTFKIINTMSLKPGDYETLKKSSIDPYNSFKNFYIQYRNEKIKK